jgi:hypothetical protein
VLGGKYAQHILVEKPLMKYKIEKKSGLYFNRAYDCCCDNKYIDSGFSASI